MALTYDFDENAMAAIRGAAEKHPEAMVSINGKQAVVCSATLAVDPETGEILKAVVLSRDGKLVRMTRYNGKTWNSIMPWVNSDGKIVDYLERIGAT